MHTPVVVSGTIPMQLGLAPEDVIGRVFGGIEQEHADKTHRDGKRDLAKLEHMVQQGLERLLDFQHGNGGWGWWKAGPTDHFMTTYVLWGLTLTQSADVAVDASALARAADLLDREMVEQESNYDMQAWMLHALAVYRASSDWQGKYLQDAFDNLWENRDRLNAYSRALLALAAYHLNMNEEARTLVRNLENGVQRDTTPDTSVIQRGEQTSHDAVMGTAHWGQERGYWRWSRGAIESTAFVLRALLAIEPAHPLVEPATNWLIKNRRGAQWSNTRDTAIVVLALNDYLRTSGELTTELEYVVEVNGQLVATQQVTPETVLSAPSTFTVDAAHLRDGVNEIVIRRTSGDGPLYFATHATYFSLEEPIAAVGNEIFVRRQYTRLNPRETLLKGITYERESLDDQGTVTSSERVEVAITIEAKNDMEYLVLEDLKPAGLEAVQIRSGEPLYARELKADAVKHHFTEGADGTAKRDPSDLTGRSQWVYQELRDRKVALFIDKLPQGIWEIRYELRAEVPGQFHALPVMGHAMYVPEIRCNGAEIRMSVGARRYQR